MVKFDEDRQTKLKGNIEDLAFKLRIFSSYSIIINCFRDTYLFFILISESTEEPKMTVGECLALTRMPSIKVSSPLI